MHPVDPYVEAALPAPPSPDYVPGPEEPEQAPPSPDYPYDADASPTALSPGYIVDFDPKDESEDGPTDYPADGGDDDDDDSSRDVVDDKDEEEASEEDKEEEHLASANTTVCFPPNSPIPFPSEAEVARLLAIPTPPPSPLTPLSSLLPQIPSPPSSPLLPPVDRREEVPETMFDIRTSDVFLMTAFSLTYYFLKTSLIPCWELWTSTKLASQMAPIESPQMVSTVKLPILKKVTKGDDGVVTEYLEVHSIRLQRVCGLHIKRVGGNVESMKMLTIGGHILQGNVEYQEIKRIYRVAGNPATDVKNKDPLGKFVGKAMVGFLVGLLVNSKVSGNQTNKSAGPQNTNGNTCLKKNVDAGQSKEKNVSIQQHIVIPLWSSISLSYQSSDDKGKDNTADDDAGDKSIQKPASENE
ncbi:hypothetical protein Tco_0788743 [Tanacetum coccineum]